MWQPLNLSEQCPAQTQLTACSPFGHIFLNLLVHVLGDSYARRYQTFMENESLYVHPGFQNGADVKQSKDENCKSEEEEYDFIVVGAGAAGCILANRLTEITKWKVLLMEAGGEQPDVTMIPALQPTLFKSSIDWSYKTQPDGINCLAGDGCSLPRGKVLGGSTVINGFVYNRGNKLDYDWDTLGNTGWSYEELLPYFKKSEDNLNINDFDSYYHGVEGEQLISFFPYYDNVSSTLVEAYKEMGLNLTDINGANQLGVMYSQGTVAQGLRVSANQAFIEPIRYTRKNLNVKLNSEAIEILIDDQNVAYGVKYENNGRTRIAKATKEVIVSAGTIASPKLLLLSGIGPEDQLKRLNMKVIKDSAVGENFQDHVSLSGLTLVLPKKMEMTVSEEEMLDDIRKYKYSREKNGPLSNMGSMTVVAYMKTDSKLSEPDVQIQAITIASSSEYYENPISYNSVRTMPACYYDAIEPRAIYVRTKSKGKILLNETNPFGPPVIYPNYLADDRDVDGLLNAIKLVLSLEDTNVFKSNGLRYLRKNLPACKNYDWGTDEYFVCIARSYTSPMHHLVGTCKMGPKGDEEAVVDPRLRVHGVERLRVIDTSVAPKLMGSNTVAAAFMIAEKGADMIKEDWLTSPVTA